MGRAIPREGQHTVNASEASYLAGFLDGDGSIHFQLVRQKEYRFGFYIRSTLSLSQSTTARAGLEFLQSCCHDWTAFAIRSSLSK
jgi:hypothetical protein